MRTLWIATVLLVAMTTAQGCKQRQPQPIPGPKASHAVAAHIRTPGIAWFQGSLDEGFARAEIHRAPPQSGAPSRRWCPSCPARVTG